MNIADDAAALLGVDVIAATRVHGGDLSTVYRLTLADGTIVAVKTGTWVAAEAAMLRALQSAGAPAPEVIACGEWLLVMEWLAADSGLASAWDDLAAVLVRLHGNNGVAYGWSENYAFGAVEIRNEPHDEWPTFWADRRLLCHVPFLPAALGCRIERLASSLPDLLPRNPPSSLLHGDLWAGNVLVSRGVVSGLIDPACYNGDREVDVAMLTLFDHPPPRFFEALALEPGWPDRQPVYRLSPWLVHLRLFGAGYLPAVESCLGELGV